MPNDGDQIDPLSSPLDQTIDSLFFTLSIPKFCLSVSLSVTLIELKSPIYLCEKIIPSRLNTFPSSFPSIVSLSSLLPFPFPTSLLEQGVKSIRMDPIDFPT